MVQWNLMMTWYPPPSSPTQSSWFLRNPVKIDGEWNNDNVPMQVVITDVPNNKTNDQNDEAVQACDTLHLLGTMVNLGSKTSMVCLVGMNHLIRMMTYLEDLQKIRLWRWNLDDKTIYYIIGNINFLLPSLSELKDAYDNRSEQGPDAYKLLGNKQWKIQRWGVYQTKSSHPTRQYTKNEKLRSSVCPLGPVLTDGPNLQKRKWSEIMEML